MIPKFDQHASNERTFLAWVRTVVAILGFGIAAARIGANPAPWWSEVVMLFVGAVVILLAYLRMQVVRHRIDSEHTGDDMGSRADMLLALLVVAVFVLLGTFALNVTR